nr:serine/threonine protein kinase [Polyangiaceae bacterium]
IAQGGMGVIYSAEHLATEEQVALKVLWPHVLGSKAAVEKFQLEARVAARVGGEHIVRILDAGFDDKLGVPFLAMELLRGRTLEAVVQPGPLSPAELLVVFRQVAKALDKAHGYVDREGRPAPIVHRDLKPENLFVALRDEGEAVVKVLDFGIAKVVTQSQKLSQEVRGTPRYMAYEQFTAGPITPRLDVWALGLIAYTLLTGRAYWSASAGNDNGLAQLLTEVITLPLEPPSQRARQSGLEPSWPAAFDAWFLQCVNRNVEARFASAGAAAEALRAVFAGAAVGEAELAAARSSLTRKAGQAAEKAPAEAFELSEPVVSSKGSVLSVGSTELVDVPPSWPSSARGPIISGATVPAEPLAVAMPNSTTGSVASSLLAPPPTQRKPPVGLWAAAGVGLLGLAALGAVLAKPAAAPGAGPSDKASAALSVLPAAATQPATAAESRPGTASVGEAPPVPAVGAPPVPAVVAPPSPSEVAWPAPSGGPASTASAAAPPRASGAGPAGEGKPVVPDHKRPVLKPPLPPASSNKPNYYDER